MEPDSQKFLRFSSENLEPWELLRIVPLVTHLWQTYGFCCHTWCPATIAHSLTAAWPAEGRSVLHIERSWPAIQAAPTDRPTSSSTCCSQFLCGRPGGRFQSAAGGVPVSASIDSWSACEAGVYSGRRQMCPNNEWHLSAIRDGISGSFVLSLTTALGTLSYHLIPRIRRSACMWKDWILSLSTLRIVHVSEPYNMTITFHDHNIS